MTDPRFMRRALELAAKGAGYVSPNPMVGCVVVHNERIIGEGFHQQFGGPHAEVNAIADVSETSLLEESIVYVTLEPCSHFGKTPPCADLLVEKRVRKVVICNEDPNPKVAGRGLERLRAAGIEVEVGLLADEGLHLNRRFFTFFNQKRPYVILKWAQTLDGFVARENFDSKWISNLYSRQLVHKWRAEEAAIMVGKRTALYDNPSLTVRDWSGPDPVRVVVDSRLELSAELSLFDKSVKTLVFTQKEKESSDNLIYCYLHEISPYTILKRLFEEKILSVFIEGGSYLLHSFIEANLWDEARVFTSSQKFGKGIEAPELWAEPHAIENVQGDVLTKYFRQHG